MSKRKKRKLKKLPLLILILIIAGVGYYFYKKSDGNILEKAKEKIKDIVPPVVEKKVQIVNLDSNSRPIAVMINNVGAAWKYQAGICDAYMVYSLLVEGGITREMALFKDAREDTKIMSIRSARHYYIDYVLENDAIYTHWGWSPYAESDIKKLKINNINGLYYEGSYFLRDKELRSQKVSLEHTGYITMESINKANEKFKYRTTTDTSVLLNYKPESVDYSKVEDVQNADHIEIKYSAYYTAKYDYDEKTKTYKKMQNKVVMEDYNDTCDLTYKNIITYQIPYSEIAGDKKGRLNATTTGEGKGYLITEGKAIPITWQKTSRESKTIYKLLDGTDLIVNDGLTAIELQPKNQKLIIEAKPEEESTTTTTTKKEE